MFHIEFLRLESSYVTKEVTEVIFVKHSYKIISHTQ